MAKKEFRAESKRLLDLMINSIYTHREIFLREIISNASDAIDKLCYLSLTDEGVGMTRDDFRIDIDVDKDARVITVSDNGIGMDRDALENNLGVIANSGSFKFKNDKEDLADSDIDIIGQFGVGFYSAFMVSSRVVVKTRAYGSQQGYMWESDGADGYTITECDKDAVGTEVIMYIKEDTEDDKYSEFLERWKLRALIRKYSDYVRWPIKMGVEFYDQEDTGEKDEDGKPVMKDVEHLKEETINSMVPIWQRSKTDVTDEQCMEFYKDKYMDDTDPVAVIRINAEGTVSYRAMLFIPSKAPYNYYTRDFKPGLQLYSNSIMIMEKCEDLLPECFRFVCGVVDSPDLSLNISREMLQHDRQLKFIAKNLEKKIKSELKKLMDNEPDKYQEFYKSFGLQIKYGIAGGYGANVELLKDLVMFRCTGTDKYVSIKEYTDKMPEGQKFIYYGGAESVKRLEALPQAEEVRSRGYELFCMSDDIDEFVVQWMGMGAEQEHKFCNIVRDDLGLETDDEKEEMEKKDSEYKELLDFVKESVGDVVSGVRISRKLKSHPVCLSTEGEVTFEMEKYFNSINGTEKDKIKATRILELNSEHPAFKALDDAFLNDKDKAEKLSKILLSQALIIAGQPIENPSEYSEMICSLF